MKVKEKKVYYCDFCRKHRLSRTAMEKHERHCTLNPERNCRWHLLEYDSLRSTSSEPTHRMRRGLPRWLRLRSPLKEGDMDALRKHCMGCPACMLSAVRQAKLDYMHDWDVGYNWLYEQEVARYREDEREHWRHEERREIEATFL